MIVNPNHARTILDSPIYVGTILAQKYIMPTVGDAACLNQGEEPKIPNSKVPVQPPLWEEE